MRRDTRLFGLSATKCPTGRSPSAGRTPWKSSVARRVHADKYRFATKPILVRRQNFRETIYHLIPVFYLLRRHNEREY